MNEHGISKVSCPKCKTDSREGDIQLCQQAELVCSFEIENGGIVVNDGNLESEVASISDEGKYFACGCGHTWDVPDFIRFF